MSFGRTRLRAGLRAILNFGHTIGHALEAISHYGKYLHGEAIAIGQVAAAKLSAASPRPAREGSGAHRTHLPACRPANPSEVERAPTTEVPDCNELDKKVSGGEIKFVLARRIGLVEFGHPVPLAVIEQTLNPQPSTLNS
jgi:3-dehydroquinate synthase